MKKEITLQEARAKSKEGIHFTDDKRLSIVAKGFLAWATRQKKNPIDMAFYKAICDYCDVSYPTAFKIAKNITDRGYCHKIRLNDNSKIWTFFDRSCINKKER